ncbi:MAG: ester cyclase [Rhizobiales bacterium]|nr:ester cyclase [Hyphomicrobiales bacterium]MBI3673579.1 ester cyclase [Hyphomicrobiales bacterium]
MFIKTLLAAGMIATAAVALAPDGMAGATSAGETNAKSFRQLADLVFNRGEIDAADRFFAAGFVDHAPWPGFSPDVAGFKAGLADIRKSFPDLRMTIQRTVAEGDLFAIQSTLSGSQLGEFMGQKASGKTFSVEAIDIVRMADGRIAEHWGLIDTATMAGQLGLQP